MGPARRFGSTVSGYRSLVGVSDCCGCELIKWGWIGGTIPCPTAPYARPAFELAPGKLLSLTFFFVDLH